MSTLRQCFYLSLFYCALYLSACTYDHEEVIPVFPEFPEHLSCDENIGSFSLLISSLKYTPYKGKDSVAYIDSLGNKLVFSITEHERINFTAALIKYNVYAAGDTVWYCYQSERKSFSMENAALDLNLWLSIDARPDYENPEPGLVSDEFSIWYSNPDPPPFSSSQVFIATINVRTGSYSYNNIVIPQMEVFGKTFYDVERINYGDPDIRVWFNRTEGIVAFVDPNGMRWRWNGFR